MVFFWLVFTTHVNCLFPFHFKSFQFCTLLAFLYFISISKIVPTNLTLPSISYRNTSPSHLLAGINVLPSFSSYVDPRCISPQIHSFRTLCLPVTAAWALHAFQTAQMYSTVEAPGRHRAETKEARVSLYFLHGVLVAGREGVRTRL